MWPLLIIADLVFVVTNEITVPATEISDYSKTSKILLMKNKNPAMYHFNSQRIFFSLISKNAIIFIVYTCVDRLHSKFGRLILFPLTYIKFKCTI